MGLFDNIENSLDSIAGKVGLSTRQVREVSNTFQANLTGSDGNPLAAIEAPAAQQGVSVATIQEILNYGGGLEGELRDIADSLFKTGQ